MPNDLRIDVDLKGPFFSKHIDEETKQSIFIEVLDKVDQRVMRTPRSPKLGRKNNTLESRRREANGEYAQDIDSTLNYPRTTGSSWVTYNMAAIRKLAPNVIRAAGRRIASSLGGS